MDFIRSIQSIKPTDFAEVGFPAADLGLLNEKKFSQPLSFVITTKALTLFLEHNNLLHALHALQHNPQATDGQVEQLFLQGQFPQGFEEEVLEAYETLGGSPVHQGAQHLVSSNETPYVMLVRSPNYLPDPMDHSGTYQNLHGKEQLLKAIKLSWASLYTKNSTHYQQNHSIKQAGTGLIIMQMLDSTACANVETSADNDVVTIKTYFGLTDVYGEVTKDEYEVNEEYLNIVAGNVQYQPYAIARNSIGDLYRKDLRQEGGQQKVHDKSVMELARMTKRIKQYTLYNVFARYCLLGERIFLISIIRTNKVVPKEVPAPIVHETTPEPQTYVPLQEIKTHPEPLVQEPFEEEPITFDFTTNESFDDVPESIEDVQIPDEQPPFEVPEPLPRFHEEPLHSTELPTDFLQQESTYTPIVTTRHEPEPFIPENIIPTPQEETPARDDFSEDDLRVLDEMREEASSFEQGAWGEVQEQHIVTQADDDFLQPLNQPPPIRQEPSYSLQPQSPSAPPTTSLPPQQQTSMPTPHQPASRVQHTQPRVGDELLQVAKLTASSAVLKADLAITKALKSKYETLFNTKARDYTELIASLKQHVNIPLQYDIEQVHDLRNKVLEEDKVLTGEQVAFVLRTAESFLDNFQ